MMQNTKPVSVIIAAYNAEKTLSRTLESLCAMNVLPAEILVVDDGSDDRTAELCGEYCGFSRTKTELKYIHRKHFGVSAARNTGIAHASNDWVMFCDADDVVYPGWLEELYTMRSEQKLAVCGYTQRGNVYSPEQAGDAPLTSFTELYQRWLLNSCVNKIYNMKVLRENEVRFDTSLDFGEDLMFNLAYLAYQNGFRLSRRILYDYRPHQSKLNRLRRARRQVGVYKRLLTNQTALKMMSADDKKKIEKLGWQAIMYELQK